MGRVFSRNVTLPDQLILRAALAVPVVVVLFAWNFEDHAYWATGVFIAAMATDQVDGWLARRRNQTSPFGALLDPIADKVLVMVALVMLVGEGVYRPGWWPRSLPASCDLGLRLAAIGRGVVMGARDLGKLKTWAQALAVGFGGFAAAGAWSEDLAWWALLIAVVLDMVSGLDYLRVAPRAAWSELDQLDQPSGGRLERSDDHLAFPQTETIDRGGCDLGGQWPDPNSRAVAERRRSSRSVLSGGSGLSRQRLRAQPRRPTGRPPRPHCRSPRRSTTPLSLCREPPRSGHRAQAPQRREARSRP